MSKRTPQELADLAMQMSRIDRAASDPLLAHEALDRVDCMAQMWDQLVVNHAFVGARPDLTEQAKAIAGAIGDLYQALGEGQAEA